MDYLLKCNRSYIRRFPRLRVQKCHRRCLFRHGTVNPLGKLFYTTAENEPDYESNTQITEDLEIEFPKGNYVDYKYFAKYNITPRYKFGYGLCAPPSTFPRKSTLHLTHCSRSSVRNGAVGYQRPWGSMGCQQRFEHGLHCRCKGCTTLCAVPGCGWLTSSSAAWLRESHCSAGWEPDCDFRVEEEGPKCLGSEWSELEDWE